MVVVDKSQRGVLFGRVENGVYGWFKNGNEKTDRKYMGEISNGLPNGQGTWTHPDGWKYVGEYKDGYRWNGIRYYKNGKIWGKYVNGEWRPQ